MVRPIPLWSLPDCVFDPNDPWFGRSFVGDELYQVWYLDRSVLQFEDECSIDDDDEDDLSD